MGIKTKANTRTLEPCPDRRDRIGVEKNDKYVGNNHYPSSCKVENM